MNGYWKRSWFGPHREEEEESSSHPMEVFYLNMNGCVHTIYINSSRRGCVLYIIKHVECLCVVEWLELHKDHWQEKERERERERETKLGWNEEINLSQEKKKFASKYGLNWRLTWLKIKEEIGESGVFRYAVWTNYWLSRLFFLVLWMRNLLLYLYELYESIENRIK